ncbi:hypothetical protein J6590_004795 [Homalodisca vitripennis]|nr:hypothetical protein J6590_004795 [Homalodisca vitripennis]
MVCKVRFQSFTFFGDRTPTTVFAHYEFPSFLSTAFKCNQSRNQILEDSWRACRGHSLLAKVTDGLSRSMDSRDCLSVRLGNVTIRGFSQNIHDLLGIYIEHSIDFMVFSVEMSLGVHRTEVHRHAQKSNYARTLSDS